MMPARETERMMKLQDVILKAMAKKLTWIEAAEIAGLSVRHMQRLRARYQEFGYTGLFDQRRGKRSVHRIPMETAERVLSLYREQYFDFNVRHFHEKLQEQHQIRISYSWVKQALQGAGLVTRKRRRSPHRRRRPRRPLTGMLLHIDGSHHRWFQDNRYYDLIVILDDATSEIYYAQLVEEESTRTVMRAVREVIERKGLFCALYSDRASHFFVTPKAGEPVDKSKLTQLGRALRELGVQMIPAYSPQARGRMERSYSTWQGRLPQELRLAGMGTVEAANQFLRERYIHEFNGKFAVPAAASGSAFRRCARRDLDWIFTIQTERTVAQDNTVAIRDRCWQIEKCRWRFSLAGQSVTIPEHLDGAVSIRWGPHVLGRFDERGVSLKSGRGKDGTVESVENQQQVSHSSHRRLEISQTTRDSHFSTASTVGPPKPKTTRVARNSKPDI
jgi:transposase